MDVQQPERTSIEPDLSSKSIGSKSCRNLYFRVLLFLMPVMIGVLIFGGAMTQDGPAHLASAKIANEYLEGLPTVRAVYRLQMQPIPNWAGQALGMAVVKTMPVFWANRAMNLAGLLLPALGLVWLVQSVQKTVHNQSWTMALWISLIATNVVWTFGFSSFLIGLGLAWVQLGLVWRWRESRAVFTSVLLAIGWILLFLSHLVAFALGGLVFGCVLFLSREFTWSVRRRQVFATVPSLFLLMNYRRMSSGSKLELIWEHWDWSQWYVPANWAKQLGWVDPISLASKCWIPILEREHAGAIFVQPVFWFVVASIGLGWSMIQNRNQGTIGRPSRLGWAVGLLFIGLLGILGPDTLGKDQGHYLQQRLLLATLSLVVLFWPADVKKWVKLVFMVAWLFQCVNAVEFLRKSGSFTQTTSPFYAQVQQGDRIVALVDAEPWAYRANPRMHVDALLVFGAMDVASWNLYEASHRYFPVVFRNAPTGMTATDLEAISLMRGDDDLAERQLAIDQAIDSAKNNADKIFVIGSEDSRLLQLMRSQATQFEQNKINVIPISIPK